MNYFVRKNFLYNGHAYQRGDKISSVDLNWFEREETLVRAGMIRLLADQDQGTESAPAKKEAKRG